ncbi:Uncharacterised protein [Mycobacteroides abscessus]|nr:Uncharacterised protein [Mycobacteroides abscessus]
MRCAGTKRSGPIARPTLRCPSETRWRTESSTLATSSGETNGASMPSAKPLTRTIGMPRLRSRS